MTREKLVKIIRDAQGYDFNEKGEAEIAADRILAALEKERAGEVVLAEGLVSKLSIEGFYQHNGCYAFYSEALGKYVGKHGTLIFRGEGK